MFLDHSFSSSELAVLTGTQATSEALECGEAERLRFMYDFTDENAVGIDIHRCSLTFYEDTEERSRPDLACVSADLWRDLLFFSGQDIKDMGIRLAISVAPSTNDFPVHEANSIPGITFWISSPAIVSICGSLSSFIVHSEMYPSNVI